MPLLKASEIAYGRMGAPDLDAMEEFLVEFGMTRSDRTATRLYMRGTDAAHHIHVTEKGDSRFIGFAFTVNDPDDLARAAKAPGASGIETIDEPGGGRRVRLTEPNGYRIEVVHGIAELPPIPVEGTPINTAAEPKKRVGSFMKLKSGPSHVKRIGHGGFSTPRLPETVRWFRDTLGIIATDDMYRGNKEDISTSFSRLDRGDDYVDHHVLLVRKNEKAGLHHISYEVADVDDLFLGHAHLKNAGKYEHLQGISRVAVGGQITDFWLDPWGRMHEHWSDIDRLNASSGSRVIDLSAEISATWGAPGSKRFLQYCSP
jgi:catechol 2,3-dioxygenase-like lactoylglutathione lyase family enzyme